MKRIRGKELYRFIFYGVIFAVAAIGAFAYWGVREIRHDAAVVAVESSARGLSGAVTVLLNAVRNSNSEIGRGVLTGLEPKDLQRKLSAILDQHREVTAVLVSDDQGLRYMLSRRSGGLVEAVPDELNGTMKWTLYREGKPPDPNYVGWEVSLRQVDSVLSDEMRHLKPGQVNWRSSDRFHNVDGAWITASSLVESESGQRLMLSFAFPVGAVLSQLSGAERGSAEHIFLYWGNGQSMPADGLGTGRSVEEVDRPLSVDELDDPVVKAAVQGLGAADRTGPFSFVVEGETWWAYAMPLTVFGDTLSLGVVVPRKNILSDLTSDSFLQAGGVLLICFALGALIVLRRFRSRIEVLGLRREAAVTEEDILSLVAAGESGRVEFKQTLRFNLKSGKNGKEVEYACLKTVSAFLNSEGGTLLVGVADDGTVTGFDEDQFDSDDKALLHLNNLVNQHIGTEFSRYIDTVVVPVKGRSVLRVHCVPAPVPAILDAAKGEEFYVRSGPASRTLSLKQFHDWLKSHQ